jgi:hypothetical protein
MTSERGRETDPRPCWEVPPALTDADLTQLPGAQHLSYSSTADSDAGCLRISIASCLERVISFSRHELGLRLPLCLMSKWDAESDCSSARDGGDLGTPSVPPSRICPPDSHMRTYRLGVSAAVLRNRGAKISARTDVGQLVDFEGERGATARPLATEATSVRPPSPLPVFALLTHTCVHTCRCLEPMSDSSSTLRANAASSKGFCI